MATKTFKIGLSNTDKQNMAQDVYERLLALTFSEYDSSETYNTGDFVVYDDALYQCLADNVTGAWDSTKWQAATLQDLLDDVEDAVDSVAEKANVDGNYQTMTVGLANNLDSKLVENDQSAYNFRPTATMGIVELEVGSPCKVKKIIGGTVAYNQLIQNGNFASTSNWTTSGSLSTFGANNNIGSILASGQNGGIYQDVSTISGHKYLIKVEIKLTTATTNVQLVLQNGGGTTTLNTKETTNWQTIYKLHTDNQSAVRVLIRDNRSSDFDTIQIANVIAIDLTAMLGSTIADYIYSLEQANAGSGVAWFKRYFPKLYYAYNSGQLVSVKTQGKKITHFNQWDGTGNDGYALGNTGSTYPDATSFVTGYIRVQPNTTYYANPTNWRAWVNWYDESKTFIKQDSIISGLVTTPNNAFYGRFTGILSTKTTACINFHYDGERDGEYEPYDSETYACEVAELRGIPKLDSNNNLIFDGDEYNSDGSENVRYGVYTFTGEENFVKSGHCYIMQTALTNVKLAPSGTSYYWLANIIHSKLVATSWQLLSDGTIASGIALTFNDGKVVVSESDYDNKATLIAGTTIVYELATPTADNLDAFTETQECDNWGTEQWLAPTSDTRPCEVPVGHDTDYLPDLKAKLETAPTTPSDDGYYVLEHDESADGNPNAYTALGTALAALGYVKLSNITGYDATKTQTLKNVEGTLTWVDDE